MRFSSDTQYSKAYPAPDIWRFLLLPGCLLLLALLQSLPAPSTSSQSYPLGQVEQVLSDEPVLLSSRETPVQVRGSDAPGTKDRVDIREKQLFTFDLRLAATGAVSFIFIYTAYYLPSLLPVQVLPGSPRGPPVGS